jgi:hypothetical protein
MVRSSALLLAALAIALLASVTAGRAEIEPQPCAWESAEVVSVRRLDRDQADLRGRCVRVLALNDGWALRSQRRGRAGVEETFIGAYFEEDALHASLAERPRRVEVLGVVGHCSDICSNSSEDVICMPVGFCHYYDGPYVMISAVG